LRWRVFHALKNDAVAIDADDLKLGIGAGDCTGASPDQNKSCRDRICWRSSFAIACPELKLSGSQTLSQIGDEAIVVSSAKLDSDAAG
jgi:hypothetical protein